MIGVIFMWSLIPRSLSFVKSLKLRCCEEIISSHWKCQHSSQGKKKVKYYKLLLTMMNRRRRPRLTFYHLLASQIYTKYLGDPTKQNRTLCSQCYELKFRRTEGWQRGGSTGVCWQAHTGTGVSETMPQKQINKNIPRSLPLLHSDSKAPIIIY